MLEKLGLWFVAVIFVCCTSHALWKGAFRYRGGALVRRQERPVEYWLVTLLFLVATVIVVTIALLRTLGYLPPARRAAANLQATSRVRHV